MRKSPVLIYDEIFLSHEMPPMHPESPARLEACLEELRSGGVWSRLEHRSPRRAGIDEVAAVHAPSYVETAASLGSGYLDADTYLSPGTYDAALHAVGAVLVAVDACRDGKAGRCFCLVRPPGHHAERGRGMGFCIFNNVAAGARYAQRQGFARIMIADFDVHHGNGTQNIFYDDSSVYYFSTHQFPHYPGSGGAEEQGQGEGAGFTCNIPFPSGAGDREIVPAYEEVFLEKVRGFAPDMILVSAGYDLHGRDPLAGFAVSDQGIARIVAALLRAGADVPVIFSLEGGYDLEALAASVRITLELMCRP